MLNTDNFEIYKLDRDQCNMALTSLLHIDEDAFDSIELATFDLSHNKLSLNEEANIFDKQSNLQELTLNNNRIDSLPSTLLSCLHKLRILWHHHNQLKTDVFKS